MIKDFENKYWCEHTQAQAFRHISAQKMLHSSGVKDFLDIGSGDGFFISMIQSQSNIKGTGFELSEVGIENAKKNGITLVQNDILNEQGVQEYLGTVDTVTCLDVLEHMFDPDTALKNMSRITRQYIIFSVPNFNSITARIQVLFGRVPENNTPRKGHCYWFNSKVIHNLCSRANLEIVEVQSNTLQVFHKIGIDKILLKLFPNIFALSFTVLCKKIEKV